MIQNRRENHERGKRHPHDFLTPNAFTTVWRVPVSCYFSGVTRAFFLFFTNPLGIFFSLSPLDHHRLLFFFDSILYLFQSFSNNQFLKIRRKLNYYIFKMELKFFFQNIRKIFARKYKLSKKEMINIVFTKILDRKKYLSLNYSKTFR